MASADPLNEYKSEAFQLFEGLITRLREQVTAQMMRVEWSSRSRRSRNCRKCMPSIANPNYRRE